MKKFSSITSYVFFFGIIFLLLPACSRYKNEWGFKKYFSICFNCFRRGCPVKAGGEYEGRTLLVSRTVPVANETVLKIH